MKAGKYKELKLRHGTSEREFRGVEVRAIGDQWELEGTELVRRAVRRKGVTVIEIEKVNVTVGFLAANVIED